MEQSNEIYTIVKNKKANVCNLAILFKSNFTDGLHYSNIYNSSERTHTSFRLPAKKVFMQVLKLKSQKCSPYLTHQSSAIREGMLPSTYTRSGNFLWNNWSAILELPK